MKVTRVGPEYDNAAILGLIQREFAGMAGRIDPPSSMLRLTVSDIKHHAIKSEIFVIENKGQPVACLFGWRVEHRYCLGKIAVDAAFRGKGFARDMVNAAEGFAANLGSKVLELECRIELVENHAAFARLGFVKTGEKRHKGFVRTTIHLSSS